MEDCHEIRSLFCAAMQYVKILRANRLPEVSKLLRLFIPVTSDVQLKEVFDINASDDIDTGATESRCCVAQPSWSNRFSGIYNNSKLFKINELRLSTSELFLITHKKSAKLHWSQKCYISVIEEHVKKC